MNRFSRSQAASVILVALLLLSFYGWRHYSRSRQTPQAEQFFPMTVVVRISGKVRVPGNYSFDQPVSVSEAVTRAGGLISSLEPEPGWTKLYVANGRRLHIATDANGASHLHLGWMTVPSRLALGVPLDVNQISAGDLSLVPGINQELAARIVAQRQRLGGFSRLEELLLVHGIGPVSLKRLRQYFTVGSEQKVQGTRRKAQGARGKK